MVAPAIPFIGWGGGDDDRDKKLPKNGDKELYLTELGQKFKDNGNKMP
jgi:hypothetical protein